MKSLKSYVGGSHIPTHCLFARKTNQYEPERTIILALVFVLVGCSTCKRDGEQQCYASCSVVTNASPSSRSEPTNPPLKAIVEFDGSKVYPRADSGYSYIWFIQLPHTTDIEQIKKITVWINTTGVEGRRLGTNVYCDEIQIVKDEPSHGIITVGKIFRTEMESSNHDADKITKGYAEGDGDVFTLSEGSEGFQELRECLAKAQIPVKLVNRQPIPHDFHVNSARVLATSY